MRGGRGQRARRATHAAGPAPPTGATLAALAAPPVYGPLASQRIYFVMPDRYANGDPSNDLGGLSGTRGVTGYDPTATGYYHGGDLKGLVGGCETGDGLARISDLGFTAVWVTPPVKQKPVIAGTRPATTATGASTSPPSTRTSAPRPTSPRSSTARTGSG